MAVNETVSTKTESQTSSTQSSILSYIKGFFQKSDDGSGEKKRTRAFGITRKEALITTLAAILVIIGGGVYGWLVYEKYTEINDNIEPLRELSTYNVEPDDVLFQYSDSGGIKTIEEMIKINNNIEETVINQENSKKEEKISYDILLRNIFLPSLNIWKDPYTKNFDTTILGQKYLETDKFQDLYLIQYWSDFIKYVGNDADYNTVQSISIGDKVEVSDSDYFYIPITVTFESPNKHSFLLLVNKLSMTSNSNNIALLNEFFFYLLKNIRNNKSDEINNLMQEYWKEFSSSSDWSGPSDYSKLEGAEKEDYIYKVIGYNLYHRINNDGIVGKTSPLIDDEIIKNTIRENASCNLNRGNDKDDNECFYNFREKYRNLPYLAYKIGLGKQSDRTAGLLSFLQDLPPAIAITSFTFNKHSSSSFTNNDANQYQGTVTFNAYGRNITQSELDETSSMLGKLCFGNNGDNNITPDIALGNVNAKIASIGGAEGAANDMNVLSLGELQGLFEDIQNSYEGLSKYNKMVKLFELWRMMNDANLCSHG